MTTPSPTPSQINGLKGFTPSPWFRQMLFLLLKVLVVCHLLIFGNFTWRQFKRDDHQRDLSVYYKAAHRVHEGQSPYTPRPLYGPNKTPFDYLYPPPFAALLAPTAALPWEVWSRCWMVLVVIAWWAYAACLVSLSGFPVKPWSIGIAGVFMMFASPNFGSYRAISLGQADPFLWTAFGLALIGLESQRTRGEKATGWLLGSTALVKIYSVWTFFALRDRETRKQALLGALLALCLGAALGAIVCGVSSYGDWARIVLPVAGQGTFDSDNVSFSMAVLRIVNLLGWHYVSGPLPSLAKAWLSAAACLGPIFTLWATRNSKDTMRVAIVGFVAAWCAPICWTTYLPLAFAPIALWWKGKLSQQ